MHQHDTTIARHRVLVAVSAPAAPARGTRCFWSGDRYAWDSPAILALIAATVVLSGALLARERRAADPIAPLHQVP
jgi:hypothetical protein